MCENIRIKIQCCTLQKKDRTTPKKRAFSNLSCGMKNPHHTKRRMNGSPFNLKRIMLPDIIEESRVGRPADRGNVQFHLNTADTVKVFWFYAPFRSFTIAFQEITPSCHYD